MERRRHSMWRACRPIRRPRDERHAPSLFSMPVSLDRIRWLLLPELRFFLSW